MTLADFTSPSLIVPNLRGRDLASVVQELSHMLQRENRVPDLLPFYNAVLNREFLGTTEMEAGMAFPHARLSGLKEIAFAFGRSSEPLDWGTKSSYAVRLVFLMAVPATESRLYLLLISGLVRLAKERGILQKLHGAQDTFQIFDLLQQIQLRNGGRIE